MHLTLYTSSDITFRCQTLCVNGAGTTYRDAGGHCNIAAFRACLTAYFRWQKKSKAHFPIDQTSFSLKELGFISMEVMCRTLVDFTSSC